MNVVLIPCWKRPEFLAVCLKRITEAKGWKDHHYHFTVDSKNHHAGKHDPQVLEVIRNFPGQKSVKILPNGYNGNTYNMLEGYREAHRIAKEKGGELVYMIETDIFIGRDFFTFHEAAHQLDSDVFYVSACRNQNYKDAQTLPNEPDKLYYYPRYQSLGVSFRLNKVEKFLKHATPKYYRDMWGYLNAAFKGPKAKIFQRMWCEQDGMLNRMMVTEDLRGLFPFIPRAYHAGFVGYNRKGEHLPGDLTLQQKIIALMAMTEEEMNRRAGNPQFKDITMCDLLGHDVRHFQIVQNAVPIPVAATG